jgi:hypothetical protein
MSNLDSLLPLAQANESSIGFQNWLIFGGFVIIVLTVLVVQGGLYLAHRANWWQSDAPEHWPETERPLPTPTLVETEDLHRPPPERESEPQAPREKIIRRRSA